MYLSDISKKDKSWDREKLNNLQLVEFFANSGNDKLRNWASRSRDCCQRLFFGKFKTGVNVETGEVLTHLKLVKADFCHVRTCPICMNRRKLYNIKRFVSIVPDILDNMPKCRFLFLTLTVKNCEVLDTRATLNLMNIAWKRFILRDSFNIVKGWVRATEITNEVEHIGRRKVLTMRSHPHFHVLLLVPEAYFKGGVYLKKATWAKIWGESLKVDYLPIVDIRTIKSKNNVSNDLVSATLETLKYSIKSTDMLKNPEWGCKIATQIHGLKFLTSGGCFKGIFKKDSSITNDDLLLYDEGIKEELLEVMIFLFGKRYFLESIQSKEVLDQVTNSDSVKDKLRSIVMREIKRYSGGDSD